MRVLYFSRDYTTHDRRFLAKIAEHHEVFYLRLQDDGMAYEARPVPDGVKVVPWALGKEPRSEPNSLLRLMPAYQEVIERIRPDLIHAGPVQSCGFLTALTGFHPFLLMSWGSDILIDADRDSLWRWVSEYALDKSDMLLCDCMEVSTKAGKLANYSKDKIVQFPWGVDVATFRPGHGGLLRDEVGWLDATVVISTRTWRLDYGTDVLLNAFRIAHRINPRLRLALLGDGPMAPVVRGFVEQHRLQGAVRLIGLRPEEELPEYFRSADIYLSCAPSDGSSVSLLGAMASGLPIIVSDRPSNREWITHKDNGWLAKAGDPESFAEALVEAASVGHTRLQDIAATNREIVMQRADWNRNFPQLLAAYDRLGLVPASEMAMLSLLKDRT